MPFRLSFLLFRVFFRFEIVFGHRGVFLLWKCGKESLEFAKFVFQNEIEISKRNQT